MHFGYIQDLLTDPRATLMFLLLALPGRLLAISCHEAAHAWVADRCGDPTARMMGRVTLNPIKHLDPVGILCMVVLGIGWARPVPVNPRNFRDYRKDDLKVSLAGVVMNILLFLAGCIVMYGVIAVALASIPWESAGASSALMRARYEGTPALISGRYWYDLTELMRYGVNLSDLLIVPVFGEIAGYLYQMLGYFVMTNLVLAVFNLIPLPPLDGYHVLNDTLLRRSALFASLKTQGVGMAILYIAMFSGVLSDGLGWVYSQVLSSVGSLATVIFRAFGLF